jgi:glycosyltransferase involved in cell wall biosynthesis
MNIEDKRKGFEHLQKSLEFLHKNYLSPKQDLELVVFGKSQPEVLAKLPFKVHNLGFLSNNEALVNAYSAANAFVLPSLEDNLPNTVMEALACATPVIAFNIGGVPEMVEHQKNGYLADFQEPNALAMGIFWLYEQYHNSLINSNLDDLYGQICQNARQKVITDFNEKVVSERYYEVYEQVRKVK